MLPREHSYRRKRFAPQFTSGGYQHEEGEGGERRDTSFCLQLDEELIRDMVLMEKELKVSPEVMKVLSLIPGMCVERVDELFKHQALLRFSCA